jgi:hypothetical protein
MLGATLDVRFSALSPRTGPAGVGHLTPFGLALVDVFEWWLADWLLSCGRRRMADARSCGAGECLALK